MRSYYGAYECSEAWPAVSVWRRVAYNDAAAALVFGIRTFTPPRPSAPPLRYDCLNVENKLANGVSLELG